MAFMCGSSRLSRALETGAAGRFARAVGVAFGLILAVAAAPSAHAQGARVPPPPAPAPAPSPTPSSINSDISAGSTVTNLGSSFLERLGNQASNGFGRALRSNPGGG